jgi:hypothetical protein
MSPNMLIEFGDAFDFSGADFWEWRQEAEFKRYQVLRWQGRVARQSLTNSKPNKSNSADAL